MCMGLETEVVRGADGRPETVSAFAISPNAPPRSSAHPIVPPGDQARKSEGGSPSEVKFFPEEVGWIG